METQFCKDCAPRLDADVGGQGGRVRGARSAGLAEGYAGIARWEPVADGLWQLGTGGGGRPGRDVLSRLRRSRLLLRSQLRPSEEKLNSNLSGLPTRPCHTGSRGGLGGGDPRDSLAGFGMAPLSWSYPDKSPGPMERISGPNSGSTTAWLFLRACGDQDALEVDTELDERLWRLRLSFIHAYAHLIAHRCSVPSACCAQLLQGWTLLPNNATLQIM